MKSKNEMTGIEKIAYKNIKGIFSWDVGGWYNSCIYDGCPEDVPETIKDAKQFIYEDAMENKAGEGFYQCGAAPREMRFAGSEFINSVIDYLFETDFDIKEIAAAKNW